MRIAICTPGNVEFSDYASGDLLGTEYQIWGLAQELARRGHEVQIARRADSRSPEEESIRGVRILNIRSREFRDSRVLGVVTKFHFSSRARERLVEIRPDVMILTDMFSSMRLAGLSIGKVFAAHNPPSGVGYTQSLRREGLKRVLEHYLFGNCQLIVALNQSILEDLRRRNYRSVLIPNGVDIERYPREEPEDNYILSAGRLVGIKGVRSLLSAYSELDQRLRSNFRLMIVGSGPERKGLESMAVRLGLGRRVEFVNWQPNFELIKIIARCATFVLPSAFEVCPVTLIEAMACRKTVISSDIPGTRDIIEHQQSGMLFERGNITALKNTLEEVLLDRNLRSKLGANARRRVEQQYTFEKITPMYEEILMEAQRPF